jgi:dihydroxyacetone kinase-like protein
MKKLINSVDTVLSESLQGLLATHGDILSIGDDFKFVRRRNVMRSKVALISGGGSGHEPLHVGFVGRGMLDAACPGQIFTSPTPDQMVAAVDAVSGPPGTLFIVKNYEGDVMNFEMAAEMVAGPVASIIVDDDVAVKTSPHSTGRRGVAGTLVVERIVGAAAEQGRDLETLAALGRAINTRTRSMGVALTSCTVPAVGRPTFSLGEGEMEMGVGIHGEPGCRRQPMACADEIADELLTPVLADLAPPRGTPCLLIVNGFGGTPTMELYLMANCAARILAAHGLILARSLVGSFVTSLDMAGCSLTVTTMDDEALALWDSPVHTAALQWEAAGGRQV